MPKKRVSLLPGPWDSWSGTPAGKSMQFIETYVVLPAQRQPMTLNGFQRDLIEQWCDPSTKAHATVIGAGNAKTATLAAFVTSQLFICDESDVPVVAETTKQAWKTTLGRVNRYVELHPELDDRSETLRGEGSRQGVYVPYRSSHAYAMADRPDGLQGLEPSIAVLEEMSEATIETFGALLNRMGKRYGSKLVGISTPSFTEDNALLHVQRAAAGEFTLPNVVLTEYISDQRDHRDESQWWKANPALLTEPAILDIEAIRTDLAVLPEQMFRAYRLCQNPVGAASCWLNALDDSGEERGDAYEAWKRCANAYSFREGAPMWCGVDVAKSRDHAAVVWGQFRDDGRLHVKHRIWTPNPEIDLDSIASHLHELAGKYDVRGIWYDPSYFANAPVLAKSLPMVEIPPTETRMAPYVGAAYEAIRRVRITHDDHDELTNNVLNAKRHYTSNGFTLDKRQYSRKIDACIALVLCIAASQQVDNSVQSFGWSFRNKVA